MAVLAPFRGADPRPALERARKCRWIVVTQNGCDARNGQLRVLEQLDGDLEVGLVGCHPEGTHGEAASLDASRHLDPAILQEIKHLSDYIGHTSKTRALFEVNKGVNVNPTVDVNARMSESQRRVPLRNMIYVADGPSDVPMFSILNKAGDNKLGGDNLQPRNNHKQVKQLQEQGRIQGMAEADYRPGKAAHLWLMDSLDQIAREIVDGRHAAFASIPNPPGHA